MYATLTAAALAFAAAQPPDTGRAGQPGSTPGIGQPGAAAGGPMIDGTWTIVVLEKNGQPVTDAAKNMTVSIRGNVATFNKTASAGAGGTSGVQPAGGTGGTAGAAGSSEMRALRLDFGPGGMIRVTEAGADGKFGAGTTGTTGTPGTTGTTGTPGSSPGLGAQSGVRTGVYVLTQDYLAVCVHDTATGAGTPGTGTTTPGTGTDRDRPGSDRPSAGTNPQPGGTSGVGDGRLPAQRSYVTVILRRDAGSRPGGTGTGTPGADR